MVKQHLKRIFTPKTWQIGRKLNVFITRPKPGAHKLSEGVSINTFFKEMIKYCKTTKEVKQILNNKEVLVDGTRRKDHRLMIGLMDVISVPSIKENFRILISDKGHLSSIKINDAESKTKPSKIANKTIIAGGKIQLNFTDGRNVIIKKNDYKTGDTLILNLPDQKITKHFKLEKGAYILLTSGSHVGMSGQIIEIKDKVVKFKTKDGEELETKLAYSFVIGDKKPSISLE